MSAQAGSSTQIPDGVVRAAKGLARELLARTDIRTGQHDVSSEEIVDKANYWCIVYEVPPGWLRDVERLATVIVAAVNAEMDRQELRPAAALVIEAALTVQKAG